MTNHPEPVSQSLTPQQQPQYNLPERDKQLLFTEYNFEDLSASFRSLYKSVFEQSLSQQGELLFGNIDVLISQTRCSTCLILEQLQQNLGKIYYASCGLLISVYIYVVAKERHIHLNLHA